MPHVSRVHIMNRAREEIRVVDGPVHIRRWDNVVHITERGAPAYFYVDTAGRVDSQFCITAVCGRNAKMHLNSRNRFTEDAATCITCVAGELR
jgi:hypothetical protein